MWFHRSASLDPFENLALEDSLLDAQMAEPTLLVYVNRPCVVIGKHQNPWRECDLTAMEADSIPLIRRVSGGGAVYHDAGNLNVALLAPRATYRREEATRLFTDALAELGVSARAVGPSSLMAGERKVSGQAYCYRRETVLHHGTLLLKADLDRLNRYLLQRPDFDTHAVASVPAEVANLGLQVDTVIEALVAQAGATPLPELPLVKDFAPFKTWDWCFGKTPRFTFGGEVVQRGIITESPNLTRIGQAFSL